MPDLKLVATIGMMKSAAIPVLPILAALWLTGGITEARLQLEDAGLVISGTVRVPGTREPVVGAVVGLYRPNTVDPPTMVTTGPDGRFLFRGLDPGRHDLTLADESATEVGTSRRVDLREGGLPREVDLWLAPLATVSDSFGGFLLEDVPPGTYRLLALDEAGLGGQWSYWESPEFLRDFELRGEPVTIDPDARVRIDVRAVPLYE
jgi:Carboxypeptidase regulatory-like domain